MSNSTLTTVLVLLHFLMQAQVFAETGKAEQIFIKHKMEASFGQLSKERTEREVADVARERGSIAAISQSISKECHCVFNLCLISESSDTTKEERELFRQRRLELERYCRSEKTADTLRAYEKSIADLKEKEQELKSKALAQAESAKLAAREAESARTEAIRQFEEKQALAELAIKNMMSKMVKCEKDKPCDVAK